MDLVERTRADRADRLHARAALAHGLAQSQEDDGRLVLGLQAHEQDVGSIVEVGVGRPERSPSHRRCEELRFLVAGHAVAEVDVIGAECHARELGVGVGILARQAPAEDHAGVATRVGKPSCSGIEGLGPRCDAELAVLAHQRGLDAAIGRVDEGEATLVAVPLLVDLGVIPGQAPRDHTTAYVSAKGAAGGAVLAGGRRRHEVERPRTEAIKRTGERTHRADLNRVARVIRVEWRVWADADLLLGTPLEELEHRVAGDLLGKAGAARARDAALAIEQDLGADIDGLGEGAALLLEAGHGLSGRHRLVLQRALPALVADGAVERVIEEQELHHSLLRLIGHLRRALGLDDHPVGDRDRARGLRLALALDLDQAHAACRDRVEERVIAKARDLDAHEFGHADDKHALGHANVDPVDGHGDDVDGLDGSLLGREGHRAAISVKR